MSNKSNIDSYDFNWESFEVIASGKSSLDASNFLFDLNHKDDALKFLDGYGYDLTDPVQNAEMFGNFQEALAFIKKYFLKEGNEEYGLELTIPNIFYTIVDTTELLLIATGKTEQKITEEDSIWAMIILKVMHTILHLDKDLRYRYYSTIQTQIFDRFYKFLQRKDDELFLGTDDFSLMIPLVEFETKSKKTRDSTIIKLLHKKENVAEELFDRIGIRFVTHTKIDCLRVMKFLHQNYIIMANNIKPSRSQNSLVNFEKFEVLHKEILDRLKRGEIEEDALNTLLEEAIEKSLVHAKHKNNEHTSNDYRAIHFTCRQLIKHQSPFYKQFNSVRNFARKNDPNNKVTKSLLDLDTASIAKEARFFYPFEIQITDIESHRENTDGEASHQDYKKSQIVSAMGRVFNPLLKHLNKDLI